MKKLLPLLLLLVMASSAQAQYKPIRFGFRVGANLDWIKPDADGYSGEGAVPGFTWGFIGEFFMMENYAILTGFNINFIGGKLEYPYHMDVDNDMVMEDGQLHRDYNLKYIQVPLCLKMQTALTDKITAFGKIGLGTSFRLNAKTNQDFIYDDGEISESKKDIDDEIALLRESLIVGGGVEFSVKGSLIIIIDLTYDNAFNNMFSDNSGYPGDPAPKGIQNFVELGAGILF